MNLLAPLWVGSLYNPLPCREAYSSGKRLEVTVNYLLEQDCDLYCLCEVEKRDIAYISQAFGIGWRIVFNSHKQGYWSEWLREPSSWRENGNCIIARSKDVLEETCWSLGDGCVVTLLKHAWNNLNVISVHLDTSPRKWEELKILRQKIREEIPEHIPCIVSGDFNIAHLNPLAGLGFEEAAREHRDTTPLPQGMIDHTLVRGGLEVSDCTIHSLGSFCNTVEISGSDHYATTCVLSQA